jgi:hypothetical protein
VRSEEPCPEVLDGETTDGVPRVREWAERYFETYADQIKSAADGSGLFPEGLYLHATYALPVLPVEALDRVPDFASGRTLRGELAFQS